MLVPLHSKPTAPTGQVGFTLIELILVIVLVGVLAMVAMPRMLNLSAINARGFHDETLALLRYAQKTAVAQRRTVCVQFGGAPRAATVSLVISPTSGTTTCAANSAAVVGVSAVASKTGAGFTASLPATVSFNGLGQPLDGNGALLATTTLALVDADSIVIEGNTGYVH